MADEATTPRPLLAVCLKWVTLRPDVDALSGHVTTDDRWSGTSAADDAALELALQLAARHDADVLAISAGGPAADQALRDALAAGATRAVRVDTGRHLTSAAIAEAIAEVLGPLEPALVLCGDVSADRGSGSVPVFLAELLGLPDACGLTSLDTTAAPGTPISAVRRLDGGRRERLLIDGRAVLSVEGAAARRRRAPLDGVLAATRAPIDVRTPLRTPATEPPPRRTGPYRPRPIDLAAPSAADARTRVIELTGALTSRTPPKRLVLEPADAARTILEQLAAWGYELPPDGDPTP